MYDVRHTDGRRLFYSIFGFVRFSDEGDQQRALSEMQGVYCGVRPMPAAMMTLTISTGSSMQSSQIMLKGERTTIPSNARDVLGKQTALSCRRSTDVRLVAHAYLGLASQTKAISNAHYRRCRSLLRYSAHASCYDDLWTTKDPMPEMFWVSKQLFPVEGLLTCD